MATYSPEILWVLHCCFGSSNLYLWRERREGISKSYFRRSDTSRWNSRAESLVPLGLAVERELEQGRFYSPTWLALRALENDPHRRWVGPFEEIRDSMVLAPDDPSRWVIEDYWRSTYEHVGKVFPLGCSYAYLLPPRV